MDNPKFIHKNSTNQSKEEVEQTAIPRSEVLSTCDRRMSQVALLLSGLGECLMLSVGITMFIVFTASQDKDYSLLVQTIMQ